MTNHHWCNLYKICTFLAFVGFLFAPSVAFGEHIFENREAFAEYLDTIKATSDKFDLVIDQQKFEIYYGYEGSMEADIGELAVRQDPKLVSISLDAGQKSLKIELEEAIKPSTFWVLLPIEVISAENEKYQILIDGVETRYDLTKYPTAYALGMIVPKGGSHIEIIGTHVIPEFGIATVAILVVSVIALVLVGKNSKIFTKNYH